MKPFVLLSLIGLLTTCSAPTHRLLDGLWRGVFPVHDTEIPFLFEVSDADGAFPVVTLINGEDRLDLTDVFYRNDSVFIPVRIYDAVMEAKVEGKRLTGALVKLYSNRPDGRVPFTATQGKTPRFVATSDKPAVSLDGRWEITLPARENAKQVGVFTQKADGALTGSILTPTGDYRFLEGVVQADRFFLS